MVPCCKIQVTVRCYARKALPGLDHIAQGFNRNLGGSSNRLPTNLLKEDRREVPKSDVIADRAIPRSAKNEQTGRVEI